MAKRGRKVGSIYKNTKADKFATFVVNKISKAKGANRNPVMARIIDEFCDIHNAKRGTINAYGTYARVTLEYAGYIMYSPLNSVDRRVRFLSPTPKFPLPNQRKKLEKLASMVHHSISRLNNHTQTQRSLTV